MSKRQNDSPEAGPAPKRAAASDRPARPRGDAFTAQPLSNNPLKYDAMLDGTTKVTTWNVCGLQSAASEKRSYAFRKYVEAELADVVVLTEVRCPTASTADWLSDWLDPLYEHRFWSAPGISGQVAVLSRLAPISTSYGFPDWAESTKEEGDSRCTTVEFQKYFLLATYCPNSGEKKKYMNRRMAWSRDIKRLIGVLQETKPVIWTGDFNVIMDEKDVERVGRVWDKEPGCHPEERLAHLDLMKTCDLVDGWRLIHPKAKEYTHHTQFSSGWRLDGFIVSRSVLPRVKSSEIRHNVRESFPKASDHWPVTCIFEGSGL